MQIRVKVFPSSKKERFVKNEDDTFDIYVREPAQNNMANARVRHLIAEHFNVENAIIQTGHRTRRKILVLK